MTATPTQPKLSPDAQQVELLLWDVEQVAGSLRVSTSTIHNLHRTKQLEGVMVGRHLRWQPDRVREFSQGLTPTNGRE